MVSVCEIVSTLTTCRIMGLTTCNQFLTKISEIFGTTGNAFSNDQRQQFASNGSVTVPCSFTHWSLHPYGSVSSRLTAGRLVGSLTPVSSSDLNLSVNRSYERLPASSSHNRLDNYGHTDGRSNGQAVK